MINIEDQEKLLLNIGKQLQKKITVYAIGGTAMMFQGLKQATLDIDLVFKNQEEKNIFKKATETLGYKDFDAIKAYGKKDNKPDMVSLGDVRIDLFVKKIISFQFTEEMQSRAVDTHEYQNLIIKIVDFHDIILLKCATDREKDKDDVKDIIENRRIDWDLIIQETKNQIKHGKETIAMNLGCFLEELNISEETLNKLFKIVEKQSKEKQKKLDS